MPFVNFGNWLSEVLSFPKPERPVSEELRQAKLMGYDIGAIVVRPYDKDKIHDPKVWQIIYEIVENGRINFQTKKQEFFHIRYIQSTGYSTGGPAFSVDELIVIHPAPTKASIEDSIKGTQRH